MTDLFASQMWDEVSRDMDAERADLARTAALADAERTLWPLVSAAENATDLGHRLALAEDTIALIAARRGYPAQDLQEDLTRQWTILAEARAAALPQPDPAAARYEEHLRAKAAWQQSEAYYHAVGTLTARAAADNPGVPLAQCQALAEEALSTEAAAFPLSYESWGKVKDGPIMQKIKNWTPDKLKLKPKAPAAAAPSADRNMFDEVGSRLDAAERKINPTKPSEATPGRVPDLDLSEYLKGPDRAVADNSHGNSDIFSSDPEKSGLHRVHSPDFADRRIDNGLQGIRDEQRRSDASAPSSDDVMSNMERSLDRGEQANQQSRMDAGPQPAHFSDPHRPDHAPTPQGATGAPEFMEPHSHSHSHPDSGSYEQPSLWDQV